MEGINEELISLGKELQKLQQKLNTLMRNQPQTQEQKPEKKEAISSMEGSLARSFKYLLFVTKAKGEELVGLQIRFPRGLLKQNTERYYITLWKPDLLEFENITERLRELYKKEKEGVK